MLNEIAAFVTDNPYWMEDQECVSKMALAWSILRNISTPEQVTDEEYEFVMDIHHKITEAHK